jgi:hypothetical protein
MTKSITLTRGKVALVDDADYEWLNQWKWRAIKNGGNWYAVRRQDGKIIFMHRLVIDAPDGVTVDHRNGDGLHNWRANLRLCTQTQNSRNRKKSKLASGLFKGVTFEQGRYYRARIKVDRKTINLGYFLSAVQAARAYDEAAKKYFGEFARLNFNE